ncbi:MAG TPA: M48 family metalloprotease [Pedococcus sp.]|jgi:STE24 endopeptidase|uniref:M48 family metalloprotease n=1 Tax=Pedococcus sp. TaxID=2860345 RepID=UPI002F91FCFF
MRPLRSAATPTGDRALAAAAVLATVALGVGVAVLTPWQVLPDGAPAVRPDLAAAFTPAEVARARAYRDAIGPWPYVTVVATIGAAWWFWRRSGRIPWRGPRPLVVAQSVAAASLLLLLVGLPAAWHAERVRRDVGLSTNTWPGWLRDQAVGWGISTLVLVLAITAGVWVVERFPRRWPWALAGAAAGLTVVGSLAYPLVVEPAFNTFRPLQAGAFRDAVVALGQADGLGRVDVLVSDASIRTTGENAHVSGLGATHRVVLDDTTLARAQRDPEAVLSVIGHEFGHVVGHDVARGTTIGVLGAVAGVLTAAWLLRRRARGGPVIGAGRRRAARAAAFAVAVSVTLPYVAAPVTNLISRHVEARADVHALEVTGDAEAFVRMQQGLATANLSRLEPTWWQTALFATHPDPVWRIALARAWSGTQGKS